MSPIGKRLWVAVALTALTVTLGYIVLRQPDCAAAMPCPNTYISPPLTQ